ncbi:MAG: hypothetical protein L0Y56_11610 [Nitrospira sp.]|nr:hypothetical protein [Nitrospira sp.]
MKDLNKIVKDLREMGKWVIETESLGEDVVGIKVAFVDDKGVVREVGVIDTTLRIEEGGRVTVILWPAKPRKKKERESNDQERIEGEIESPGGLSDVPGGSVIAPETSSVLS